MEQERKKEKRSELLLPSFRFLSLSLFLLLASPSFWTVIVPNLHTHAGTVTFKARWICNTAKPANEHTPLPRLDSFRMLPNSVVYTYMHVNARASHQDSCARTQRQTTTYTTPKTVLFSFYKNKYKTTIPVTLKQTNAQCCTVCQNELEVGLQVPLQKNPPQIRGYPEKCCYISKVNYLHKINT